jgi:hypothetical protein
MATINDLFASTPREPDEIQKAPPGSPVMLIDSDTICFRAAAACDGKQYSIGKKSFKYKADIIEYITKHKLNPEEILTEFYPEPLSHALGIVKGSIRGISASCQKKFGADFNMEFFHTGKTNFRDDILPEYKANRKGKRKPEHLKACKEYIAKYYNEFTEDLLEADDLLGIRAYELEAQGVEHAIVTNDKDLKTIPGWNYDWVKDIWVKSEVVEAMKFYYAQSIAGDGTDNIPGVAGLSINNKGTGRAQKIIQKASEEFYEENEAGTTEQLEVCLYRRSLDCWLEGGPGKKGSYGCESLKEVNDRFEASAECVFILHKRGTMWKPPTSGSSFT